MRLFSLDTEQIRLMNRHDWPLNQLLSVASRPANKDKVESGPVKWRVKILSFMDLSVCVFVCNLGLLPGRHVNSYAIDCA